MKYNCNILVALLISCHWSVCGRFEIIKTNGSTIIGRRLHTVFENRPYAAFWKIPYAEPPIRELRFKPPKAYNWKQRTHNYSNPYNESCASGFTEDCLYLSVFMPVADHTNNLPVIVWIHENAHHHGPDFLIDEEIIVVTVSFRTSIFGFLNTEDNFAEGNMGAKDVLMALQWTRDNIGFFNGNLNKVTVIGSGASANMVASFLLTSAAEDLFARVIIQSGSALSPADYRSYNFEILNKLYWNLNGPFKKFNRSKLYEGLKSALLKQLMLASRDLFDSTEVRDNQRLINSYGLTVEISNKNTFMNQFPLDVYKRRLINKNVEVMMGYTNLESLYKLKGFVNNTKLLKYMNYNFQYLLPFEGRKDEYGSKLYQKIKRKIIDYYFVNGTIGEGSLRRYAKYVSDQVIYPLLRQARLHSEVSCNNVYLYRFSFKGPFNLVWRSTVNHLNLTGATSGDEICYQFKCKSVNDEYLSAEVPQVSFIKKITKLLANFVKYGNPTPDIKDDVLGELRWKPLLPNKDLRGMNFGAKLGMVNLPEQKRMTFWDQLRNEFFVDEIRHDEL